MKCCNLAQGRERLQHSEGNWRIQKSLDQSIPDERNKYDRGYPLVLCPKRHLLHPISRHIWTVKCQQSMLVKNVLYIFSCKFRQFSFPWSIRLLLICSWTSFYSWCWLFLQMDAKHVGRIVGIRLGCESGFVIISSLFYLCHGVRRIYLYRWKYTDTHKGRDDSPLRWPHFGWLYWCCKGLVFH